MSRRSGLRPNQQPHRLHLPSHGRFPHSPSIAEKNRSHLNRLNEATKKWAATTPAPAAVGKNTRSATGHEKARLTKSVDLRRGHDSTGLHCDTPVSHANARHTIWLNCCHARRTRLSVSI